ncbi:MAG: multiheme c-type cytochrome, partial [Longimicrobiales bacterium]
MTRAPSLVIGFIALPLAFGCGDADRVASGEGAEPRYVGGEACATCHQVEASAWAGSHHDLAMQEADASTILADFEAADFDASGVTYGFLRRDGAHFVRTPGADGVTADHRVEYVFGVDPLQQYLVSLDGGRLQALNVAWDSRPEDEGGQRWFHLYPDERVDTSNPLHWTRLSQNWNYMCAECHSTGLSKGYDLEARSYETTWSEINVSCEACHGPGSGHVEIAESGSRAAESGWGVPAPLGDQGRQWTFLPEAHIASLPEPAVPSAEIETCAHCHARRSTISEGRLAGTPLLDTDHVSLLREGLYHPDGQIQDEVYVYGSFVQSKMYRAGVTCSDCHDPHTLQLRRPGNALCGGCHLATVYDTSEHHYHPLESAGASCVECHMPASTYMVVDPRRDHSMRVPRPDLSESIG